LGRKGKDFPYINSFEINGRSLFAETGSIESVASVLQLHHGFIFSEHHRFTPEITAIIDESRIPQQLI
jgi:hypothetical protein